MPNSLSELARASGASRGVTQMALGETPAMNPVNDGITNTVDLRRLQREACARGYVTGYIMGNAPQITLSLHKNKVSKDDKTVTYDIIAKESKPSRPLAVLMALPARCVKKNGGLATPGEIMSGMVDFATTNENEMIYQAFSVSSAIGYISALGGRLPEYAPFVSEGKVQSQWAPEAILADQPEVTYVRTHATLNKSNKTSGKDEAFRFSLKTTSSRRSLYTENNHVCLRAVEHVTVKCKTEEDAYKMNECAFGSWRYRHPKTETMDHLSKAIAECPSQIWRKHYTINGVEHEGIGSVYFMVGVEDKNSANESIALRQLNYYPWWQTGSRRESTPSRVDRIVKRELKPMEGDKKERMVTKPILWKDAPNHEMFRPYSQFVDYIISQGYIREDKLKSMGGRVSKAKANKKELTPDQMTSLRAFLRREDVIADVQAAQDEIADRVLLAGR